MSTAARAGNSGFTFVEVLMALVLFTVGALAILQLEISSTGSNFHARELTKAGIVLQGMTERLMAVNYGASELDGGDHTEYVKQDGVDYTVEYTVEVGSWLATTPTPFTKLITIEVEYNVGSLRGSSYVKTQFTLAEFASS